MLLAAILRCVSQTDFQTQLVDLLQTAPLIQLSLCGILNLISNTYTLRSTCAHTPHRSACTHAHTHTHTDRHRAARRVNPTIAVFDGPGSD